MENADILCVFQVFHSAQLRKKIRRKKKWPLTGVLIRTTQPRVISVHSWYLTSLVNLSFCRIDDPSALFTFDASHPILISISHQREVLLCGKRLRCGSSGFPAWLIGCRYSHPPIVFRIDLHFLNSSVCLNTLRMFSSYGLHQFIFISRCVRTPMLSCRMFISTLVSPLCVYKISQKS